MYVEKSLVTADKTTIVNEWVGSIAGKKTARGIEVWKSTKPGSSSTSGSTVPRRPPSRAPCRT